MNYFQLLEKLFNVYDKLEGRLVDSKTIVKKVRGVVPFNECKIVTTKSLGVYSNTLNVSGMYDPELDEDGLTPIEVEIQFPKCKDLYLFNESDMTRDHWGDMCIDFASVLGHEFIHMNQFRRRNFTWCRSYKSPNANQTIKEQQEYYGDADEVDAYAFIAATEMALESFTPQKISKSSFTKTRVYDTYIKVFDKKHPIVVKLQKKTNTYLKRLEQQYYATYRNK